MGTGYGIMKIVLLPVAPRLLKALIPCVPRISLQCQAERYKM